MKQKIIVVLALLLVAGVSIWFATQLERVRGTTHYHANIAFHMEGKLLDLTAEKYMQDVVACHAGESKSAPERVHFHEGNDKVVHVHHDGVTWQHFMLNLGFNMGLNYFIFDDGRILRNEGDNRMVYVVNGTFYKVIQNVEIYSKDRMLIYYGSLAEAEIMEIYESEVLNNAEEFNNKYDPGACKSDEKQNPIIKTIVNLMDHQH